MELVGTNSKAADPGKFKDERKWPEREKAFTNYLSVIPGVNGIPLSYIVREQDEPTPGVEYSTFNERMVHRVPLRGQYFIADARRVHNLLVVGFLHGENMENWIRSIARYQDGRRDMISLVDVEARKTFISKERHPAVTSENLSKRWNIGFVPSETNVKSCDTARRQICNTTCEPEVPDRPHVPSKEVEEPEVLHSHVVWAMQIRI
jgi:hypothetical protein